MNKPLTDIQSNLEGISLVPDWIDWDLQRPITTLTEDFILSMRAYVHVKGTKKDTYTPAIHVYCGTSVDKVNKQIITELLKKAIPQFEETLNKGWYYIYDYDEEGEQIDGSEKKVYYNKWVIMKGDKAIKWGVVSNLEEER